MKDIEEIFQKKYEIRNIIYENISVPLFKIEYVKNNENRIIEIEEISDKIFEEIKKLYNINIFPIHNNINMRISGYNFTDIKLVKYENIIEENKIRSKLIFEIDPYSNDININFYRVDFRELIEIYNNKELLFSGFITFIRLKKAPFKIFHVYCEDKFCILELSRIDDLFYYQNGSLNEIIKLHYDVKGFEILKDELLFHTNKRFFRVIIPLRGLNIRERINLGKCLIVPDLSEIKLDEDGKNKTKIALNVAIKARKFIELRNKIRVENEWSLRDVFRSMELPGRNPLKVLKNELDIAVRAAYNYGLPKKMKTFGNLQLLFEINKLCFEQEKRGGFIVSPRIPNFCKENEEFYSDHMIGLNGFK